MSPTAPTDTKARPITDVATAAGIQPDELEIYGNSRGKINLSIMRRLAGKPDGKLVIVTAITPTKAGEGKTTTSIALTQGLGKIKKKVMLCLREPSLGPVFGVKGGGTGGGKAQLTPMEEINLHFNGDFHSVSAAHNLLAAALDASIYHGNPLKIDPSTITWPRTVDMNDRQIRYSVTGIGGKANGIPRENEFVITAASEVMASLALSSDLQDLRRRLGKRVALCLREPSLGPVFGVKGGGTGGGKATLVPADDINLHFTGDLHAITAAHNLLSAMIDNACHFGSKIGDKGALDPRMVTWGRALDMNDRALRNVVLGLGRKVDGVPRQDRFDITAASEVMAIVALASGHHDLEERLSRVVIGIIVGLIVAGVGYDLHHPGGLLSDCQKADPNNCALPPGGSVAMSLWLGLAVLATAVIIAWPYLKYALKMALGRIPEDPR